MATEKLQTQDYSVSVVQVVVAMQAGCIYFSATLKVRACLSADRAGFGLRALTLEENTWNYG